MIRPIENHERLHPSEYLNRVKKTEPANSASTRDFSYEIEEVIRDEKHREKPEEQPGEDVYEPSEEEKPPENSDSERPPQRHAPSGPDEGQLDIVV